MSWFKRTFGLDWVDVSIQVALTAIAAVMARELLPGRWVDLAILKVTAISLVVFAVRRSRALRRLREDGTLGLVAGEAAAQRFDEMEQRLAELEGAQGRVADLEERLDFAERLLAKVHPEVAALPGDRK